MSGLMSGADCAYCTRGVESHEYHCTGGCLTEFSVRTIGFCGPAGAGKSTAAGHLIRRWRFQRVKFAGPLKAMAAALGLTEDEIEGAAKESPSRILCGHTPRHALQTLGTEWGRGLIGQNIWVEAWKSAVARTPAMSYTDTRERPVRVHQDMKLIVADDVRFANEAAAVRARAGFVIRITRPGHSPACGDAHPSERPDFEPDKIIVNDGSATDLRAKINDLIRAFLLR